ncbi:hypothetical protein PG995_008672 [Apiospora arundinis]
MSWLFEFPLELFLKILSYIDSGQEWKSLATVNRGFYNLAISRFWDGIDDDQKCRIFFWACAAGSTRAVNRLLELGVTVNLNLQVGYSNGLEDQDPRYYIGLPNSHIPQNGMGGYAFLPDMNDIILLDGLYYPSSCKPLHVAVSHGQKHIVEILLRHGVWIDAPSKDYCSCSDRPLSPLYRQYQPRFTALHVAICTRQEDIAQMLISNGASIYVDRVVHKLPRTDHPDHSRVTALHYCAIHDSLSTAKLMIEEGYESAINELDEYGWSPIMYAYTYFSDSVFDFLLAKGASTQIAAEYHWRHNSFDSTVRTLFHQACLDGRWNIVVKLVNHTSDPNEPDKKGKEPLLMCVEGYRDRFYHDGLGSGPLGPKSKSTYDPETLRWSSLINTVKVCEMHTKAQKETLMEVMEYVLGDADISMLTLLLDAGIDITAEVECTYPPSNMPQHPIARPGSNAFDSRACFIGTGKCTAQQTLLDYACYVSGSPDLPEFIEFLFARGCMKLEDTRAYIRALMNLCCNNDDGEWEYNLRWPHNDNSVIQQCTQKICTQLGIALQNGSVEPRVCFEFFYICCERGDYIMLEELAKVVSFANTSYTADEMQYLFNILADTWWEEEQKWLANNRLRCIEFLLQLGGSEVLLQDSKSFETLCEFLRLERGEETVLNYLDSGGRYHMAFEEDKMALCEACRYSCVRLAKRLLDLGADANQLVSDYKDEQMYWTVCSIWENGNVALLCLLLERGGNPFRSEGESGIGFPFENCLLGNSSLEFYRELCRRTINADTNDDDLFDVVDTVCSSGRYAFLQEMRSCDGRVDTLIREKGVLFLQKLLVNLSPIGENFHHWEHFKEIDEVIDTLGLILRLGGYKQLTSGWRLKKGRDNFTALIVLKKLLLPPVNPEPPLGLPSLRAYERHYCDRDYLQLSKIYLCLNSRIKIGSESSKNSVTVLGRKALGSSEIKEIEERGDIHFTTLDAKSFDDIYICICETPRWGDY